jgi:hypothetical protein
MAEPNYDGDCMPVCGNGVVDANESCDATCQTESSTCRVDDNNDDIRLGQVSNCTFACLRRKRACASGDAFCPSDCYRTGPDPARVDADCKKVAGDPCGNVAECGAGLACTDGVCCSQTCEQCQNCAADGMCHPLTDVEDATANNPCTGNAICSLGACKVKTGHDCLMDGDCVSGACEDVCSANGGSCQRFCQTAKCPAGTRRIPTGCFKTEGNACTAGTECASGLCDSPTAKCVLTCDVNRVLISGRCKLRDGQSCLNDPSHCASGLCQGSSGLCVPECQPGESAIGGFCG